MAKIKRNRNGTRKDVIIAKAAKLFREKGFSATSMRDLAEHVGVEAASLYNHISSKAEILQEICFKTANNFMSHIEEVDANPNKTAIEKIQEILRFHIKQMLDNYEEVYVSDREWKHLTDPYLSNMQSQRRAYRQRIASVEEGIRKGEIKPIDAPTAVLIMLHAVSGIESWHRSKKKIDGEVLEDNMVQILVDGLRKQA
jgi:AcrR family transcriptional regulator